MPSFIFLICSIIFFSVHVFIYLNNIFFQFEVPASAKEKRELIDSIRYEARNSASVKERPSQLMAQVTAQLEAARSVAFVPDNVSLTSKMRKIFQYGPMKMLKNKTSSTR